MSEEETPLPSDVFAVWGAAPPPEGFTARVLGDVAVPARPRAARTPWVVAATLAIAVAALLVVRASPLPSRGAHTAKGRESVRLGGRGVVVLEDGAEIHWNKGVRAIRVRQDHGRAFYRVEPGGPFVVETPAGTVTVTGTCFRVEVETMHPKTKTLIGTTIGAAVGAAVTVLVYEGDVALANRGDTITLAAGESGAAETDRAPRRLAPASDDDRGGDTTAETAGTAGRTTSSPAPGARVGALESEVARLREAIAGEDEKQRAADRWLTSDAAELARRAKRCEVRYDMPPSAWNLGATVDEKQAGNLGFTPDERDRVNRAMREEGARLIEPLRAAYAEITGNAAAAATLEPFTLQQEIMAKASPQEVAAARQRIAQERAGQAPPRQGGPPVERTLRLLSGAGDEWERRLTDIIGAERARKLRSPNRLFGRWRTSGCPDGATGGDGSD